MGSNQIASLLKNAKITKVEPRAAAGTNDLTTDVLDMAGFDSIAFVASTGDGTSGTVLELHVYGNTANSTSSPTPVEITDDDVQFTSGSGTDADNKLLIADCHRWNPAYRYAFATLRIDTQNCECDGIYAIQYNARDLPVTQGSNVIASAVVGF